MLDDETIESDGCSEDGLTAEDFEGEESLLRWPPPRWGI